MQPTRECAEQTYKTMVRADMDTWTYRFLLRQKEEGEKTADADEDEDGNLLAAQEAIRRTRGFRDAYLDAVRNELGTHDSA